MKTISIQQVLAEMSADDALGQTFLLRFVRSSGKEKGTIKVVCKARYGAPNPRGRKPISVSKIMNTEGKSKRRLHLDAGTLPMTDVETNTYFTPLISHIIGYNDCKVYH